MLCRVLAWLIAIWTLGLWAMLLVASLHLLRAAGWALGRPVEDAPAPRPPGARPLVTVQLPLRNERHVAERLLRAVCALDWPRERLEVQVLDDSDDETVALVDRVAAELRQAGHDVQVVRRQGRAGYKAGALANGLRTARGEHVLLLDADSVPAPELLERLWPALDEDERLAFVQARWSFANEGQRLLTRVQAVILHGLFLVEQARLSALARPLQFNGTAGLWRRSALERAGGWLGQAGGAASVTEDLDLSYRLQLAGLGGRTLPGLAVETELPASMAAFRAQQARWVRGAGEVLRSLGRRVLGDAGAAPPGARATMIGHLVRHARQPLLVGLLGFAGPVALGWLPSPLPSWGWPLVVACTWLAVGAYYAAALGRLGRSRAAGFAYAPVVMALSLGLAPSLALALGRGVLSHRPGEFVRTPKAGDAQRSSYRAARSPLALVEAGLGLGYAAAALWLLAHGQLLSALGLGGFVAFGLLWVSLGR